MNEEYQREEDLRDRQDEPTFRVGRVLRGTFEDQSEVLEPAITRLMLELSHLPYEGDPIPAPPVVRSVAMPPPSLLRRIASRLHLV